MSRCIIACRTLEQELKAVMKKLNCTDPIFWLDAGDHNVPARRRMAVQDAVSRCEEFDTIVLVMSLCGSSLLGVDSGNQALLLPCFNDCIDLLLDGHRQPDSYYLTEGWLAGEWNIACEYRNSLKKYGQERTDRIFSSMLRGYRYLSYIDTGCGTADGQRLAKETARILKLEFQVVPGTLKPLEDLLRNLANKHTMMIPPHTTITLDMRMGGRAHG